MIKPTNEVTKTPADQRVVMRCRVFTVEERSSDGMIAVSRFADCFVESRADHWIVTTATGQPRYFYNRMIEGIEIRLYAPHEFQDGEDMPP